MSGFQQSITSKLGIDNEKLLKKNSEIIDFSSVKEIITFLERGSAVLIAIVEKISGMLQSKRPEQTIKHKQCNKINIPILNGLSEGKLKYQNMRENATLLIHSVS